MLAELRGLNQAIKLLEVGDEPPAEITIQPGVQVSRGELRPEDYVFHLDRILLRSCMMSDTYWHL